ncbi:MAG: isochorismatase [Verrucomicrobia bacterium]|nr:MAG: isochorismatase [Verrucomicrobiota bacterium]
MKASASVVLLLFALGSSPVFGGDVQPPLRPRPEGSIKLKLRTRVETFKGSGVWDEVTMMKEVPVAEVAIIICDMWDKHWCDGATERCGALANKMAPVIRAGRAKGIQIIHAPSETMNFYKDTPQRRRVMLAPPGEFPKPLEVSEPPLPIDDSDGGCDTPQKPWYRAWTRENAKLDIGEFDGISDNGEEVYRFLRQLGVKYLIVMGVHTNMCVLNRSFAIRQMTRWGIHCMLARDLTDTMYNPALRPFVRHDQGTELVVEHIEKYWCPSLLSGDLVAGLP